MSPFSNPLIIDLSSLETTTESVSKPGPRPSARRRVPRRGPKGAGAEKPVERIAAAPRAARARAAGSGRHPRAGACARARTAAGARKSRSPSRLLSWPRRPSRLSPPRRTPRPRLRPVRTQPPPEALRPMELPGGRRAPTAPPGKRLTRSPSRRVERAASPERNTAAISRSQAAHPGNRSSTRRPPAGAGSRGR
jgi:hypothetical protein